MKKMIIFIILFFVTQELVFYLKNCYHHRIEISNKQKVREMLKDWSEPKPSKIKWYYERVKSIDSIVESKKELSYEKMSNLSDEEIGELLTKVK